MCFFWGGLAAVDVAVGARGAMAEDAHLAVDARLRAAFFEHDAAMADLELNAARGERVKAEHAIVWMLAERLHDAHAVIEDAIVEAPKIFEPLRLEHKMVDALWEPLAERHGMVAAVDVEEGEFDLVAAEELAFDSVAQAEAKEALKELLARFQ